MPDLVQLGATLMCPHGAPIQAVPAGAARVRASGQPLLTGNDQLLVSGCAFLLPPVPPTPHPCVQVELIGATLATRVKIGGAAALLRSTSGLCKAADQLPQGPALIVMAQARVRGL